MHILEAYCSQLQRNVDIYEARDAYFEQHEPRQAFEFRCSDERCRQTNNPLVSGANYRKLVEEDSVYRMPHFRSLQQHPHHSDCQWIIAERRRIAQPGTTTEPRAERPKRTNHIDVFSPLASDPIRASSLNLKSPRLIGEVSLVDEDAENADSSSNASRSWTITSRLERLVDDYESQSIEERKTNHLSIAGRQTSYYNGFIPVKFLREYEWQYKIVVGNVRVKRWPRDKHKGFFVTFYDLLAQHPAEWQLLRPTIWLPLNRLDRYVGGRRLVSQLEAACAERYYAKCYFFGGITLRDSDSTGEKSAEILLGSLGSLVVVPKRAKDE